MEAAQEELVQRGRTEALVEVEAAQQAFIEQGRDEIRKQVARERAAAKKLSFALMANYLIKSPLLVGPVRGLLTGRGRRAAGTVARPRFQQTWRRGCG